MENDCFNCIISIVYISKLYVKVLASCVSVLQRGEKRKLYSRIFCVRIIQLYFICNKNKKILILYFIIHYHSRFSRIFPGFFLDFFSGKLRTLLLRILLIIIKNTSLIPKANISFVIRQIFQSY